MWWLNTMTKNTSQTKLKGRQKPSRLTALLPLIFALPYLAAIVLLIALMPGCGKEKSTGHFELDLQSSVFGDIVIQQGGQQSAHVVINRNMGGIKFPEAIELSLIDPPDWLDYRFQSNPVAKDRDILDIAVKSHALPGIYRLQLHGTSRINNELVTDSFTFHIKVTESTDENKVSNETVADNLASGYFAQLFN